MRKTLEVSVDGDPVAKLRLSSRGFCEWFMLVQMFIFMVIISHGTLQTSRELQKFNDMLTLNVTVQREPLPATSLNTTSNFTHVKYEYLVETFYVPGFLFESYSCVNDCEYISPGGSGETAFIYFLNNKGDDSWDLIQCSNQGYLHNLWQTCIFRRPLND